MLTVNTFLDRSSVNGIGLFAAENIGRGRVVWLFHPAADQVFSAREWKQMQKGLSPSARRALRMYSYKSGNRFWLCADNAQFMNHSDSLNNIGNNAEDNSMFTLHDIRAGEELLCDNHEYSDPDDFHLERIPARSTQQPMPAAMPLTAVGGVHDRYEGLTAQDSVHLVSRSRRR